MAVPRGRRVAVLYDCVFPFVPGGGQRRLFEVCRRLVARGWQVDWYGLQSWPGSGETVVDGVRMIPVAPAVSMYRPDGKRSISQTLYYGRAIARFPGLRHYDIVHLGQWPYFHFFPARLFALFGRARVVADWWEVWNRHWLEYYGLKGWLGMLLERVCARLPTKLIAISETGVRQLGEIGVAKQRIEIVHNGIDWAAISGAEPGAQRSDLVYVGRLQPHKNVNLLVAALGLLKDRGVTPSLALIGDGPEREALEQQVVRLGLQPQVRFLGAVAEDAEVHRHLRAARVFVHPSTKEGGGSITSLEANAAGLPVVAFAHPGGLSPELIEDGRTGRWVPAVDAQALADGIVDALSMADRSEVPARCVEFAHEFDWDHVAAGYERIWGSFKSRA